MLFNSALVKLLDELESTLCTAQLWQATPPTPQALASQEPFAVDTLLPHEWLQWIFLPKMKQAIAQNAVPRGFALEPYFSEVWKTQSHHQAVLTVILQIDKACQ
ncbi:pseudouridine synthase [Vibrio metoecus]|uniref:YqcC family protein n=1 Tax=Vibrio metoecus TaxID=1481663 RepID=UPI000BA91F2A|nr:YqcC family protein [Vibrio metoecus]PAR40003.1 pseudouridine synthase [Vibrio metoecus]